MPNGGIKWRVTDLQDEIDKANIDLHHFIQRRGGNLEYLLKQDIVVYYWHIRKLEEDANREIEQLKAKNKAHGK